ncbi:hypothetical protein LguiA_028626 [Lonicera macranthoides]
MNMFKNAVRRRAASIPACLHCVAAVVALRLVNAAWRVLAVAVPRQTIYFLSTGIPFCYDYSLCDLMPFS